MNCLKQLKGATSGFRAYWSAYGGWPAFIGSPYLLIALIFTASMAPFWIKPNWWDLVLSTLPNILGFSLGGFAIFLAFGDDGFRNLIAGKHPDDQSDEPSPYLQFSATFFHFILVQICAIILSLLAKSIFSIELQPDSSLAYWNHIAKPIWWAIGFASFSYAILSVAAAAMAIFTLSRSFDDYITDKNSDQPEDQDRKKQQ